MTTCFPLSLTRRHSLTWNISQGCTTGTPAPMRGPPFATSAKTAYLGSPLTASLAKVSNAGKQATHETWNYAHASYITPAEAALTPFCISPLAYVKQSSGVGTYQHCSISGGTTGLGLSWLILGKALWKLGSWSKELKRSWTSCLSVCPSEADWKHWSQRESSKCSGCLSSC